MKKRSIQDLKTITFESGQATALIILHGYGANCHDLLPLRELMAGHDRYDWYFPDGVVTVPLGMNMTGKGWFPIRVAELGSNFATQIPQGFQAATQQMKALVETVQEGHDQIYLGGFSQGSMVATNLTMQWPELVHKLFILSGTLINEKNWRQWVGGMRDIPTFQSHGTQDPVLPFAAAQDLNQLFQKKLAMNFTNFQVAMKFLLLFLKHSPGFCMIKGILLKMKSQLNGVVEYSLPLGDELIPMNHLIGKKLKFNSTVQINDIYDGSAIKKSYGQGYSYRNFITLARCDSCIVQPEKCHFDQGTCREPKWGKEHCLTDHVVYLALTSTVKVGVTRYSQIPTRWIDQGAVKAIPLIKVKDRLTAGLIEVEMKSSFDDKTHWRKNADW